VAEKDVEYFRNERSENVLDTICSTVLLYVNFIQDLDVKRKKDYYTERRDNVSYEFFFIVAVFHCCVLIWVGS